MVSGEPFEAAGQIDATDVLEIEESHQPWELHLTQLSPGQFRSRTRFFRTERVTVYRQYWNRSVLARGATAPGYATIGTTASGSVHVNWCGRDLSAARIAWSRPGKEMDFVTSAHSDKSVALIRADVLARFLGDKEATPESRDLHVRCPAQTGRRLIETIESLVTRYTSRPSLLRDPHELWDLESEVLSAVAACSNWGPSPEADGPRRREALRCAVAYAAGRRERITVPRLAEAAGVSGRTLEYAFREGLGITPLQFMRRCRLNGAHRELRAADPEAATVTETVVAWGFSDAGRFAAEHKAVFGALPSQTLAEPRSATRHLHP